MPPPELPSSETMLLPETMLEPQTMLEPHTMLEPQTMLEPHTMLEPQTILLPHTMLEPQTIFAPETASSGIRFCSSIAPHMRFVDHTSVSVPNIVLVATGEPVQGVDRVSSARVSVTAPATLISPAPWVSASEPARGVEVYCRMA